MRKLTLIILGIAVFKLFSGCKQEKVSEPDLKSFLISYQVTSSWVDYLYNATIDQSGKLKIEEKSELKNLDRESEFYVPLEDVLLIKDKLVELSTIELDDRYGFNTPNAPTDLPTRKIKYTLLSKTDSAHLYFPIEHELPEELDKFIKLIQQTILENDTLVH